MKIITRIAAVLLLTGTISSLADAAEADYYVKLGEIKGVATDKEHLAHELTRDLNTGEIAETLKLKRETDEASVELVRAFLDGVEVELVLPSGRNLIIFITAYSQSDDGTEEFVFQSVDPTPRRAYAQALVKKGR